MKKYYNGLIIGLLLFQTVSGQQSLAESGYINVKDE